jgi:hypothetical protein
MQAILGHCCSIPKSWDTEEQEKDLLKPTGPGFRWKMLKLSWSIIKTSWTRLSVILLPLSPYVFLFFFRKSDCLNGDYGPELQAAIFITRDYTPREHGCVSNMHYNIELQYLQTRPTCQNLFSVQSGWGASSRYWFRGLLLKGNPTKVIDNGNEI